MSPCGLRRKSLKGAAAAAVAAAAAAASGSWSSGPEYYSPAGGTPPPGQRREDRGRVPEEGLSSSKAEPRPAPGEQAPPQDSGGGGSRPHADRTPGWKRGGRQAVLAAGIAPPRQRPENVAPQYSLRSQPGGRRRPLPPQSTNPWGHWGVVPCPQKPRLSLPGNLARRGEQGLLPNRQRRSGDAASLATPKAGSGQKDIPPSMVRP